RRGVTAEEDDYLKNNLQQSEKERAENLMIVDLVRNDLASSAVTGTVSVDELFGIYSYAQVHQMISTVSACVNENYSCADMLKNAFPMGSMTGAPKIKSMQLIEEYECTRRGLYSGTVGYISPDGDFDFNVVIRSLQYNAVTGTLAFNVGSAITFDSVADEEYNECLLKAKAITELLHVNVP
ncbi:MAG: chorismate-binding protein, partial [Bacteroidota bacterium]